MKNFYRMGDVKLYYVSEKPKKKLSKRTPTFFDALQILKPLRKDNLTHLKSFPSVPNQYQELQRISSDQLKEHPTPYENNLSNLLIKHGNSVSFLTLKPNQPIRREEKEPFSTLFAYADLKEKELINGKRSK